MYYLNGKKTKNKKEVKEIVIKNKNLFPKVTFSRKWLHLEKGEFGTLAAILYLAEDGITFKGKISDICKFIGISPQTKNANKRKQCIKNLAEKGIISYEIYKTTYTIKVIGKIAEKNRIRICRDEILITKKCKLEGKSVAWETVLKTWIFLVGNRKKIIKVREISWAIDEKEWGIGHAIAILKCADLIDNRKRYDITEYENGEISIYCLGQEIDVAFCFDREPWKNKPFKEAK